MIDNLLLALHLLGAVIWVGGMAFALLVLRPSLAELEPAARLALHGRVSDGRQRDRFCDEDRRGELSACARAFEERLACFSCHAFAHYQEGIDAEASISA